MPDIEGIVLAGGQSSRFGSDKCLYVLNGVPLVERAVGILSSIGAQVTILTSVAGCQKLSRFGSTLADEAEARGPVQPLSQAARFVRSTHFAVLPCDTPFVSQASMKELVRVATQRNLEACIAQDSSGRLHPLVACYSKAISTPGDRLLATGSASVHDLIGMLTQVELIEVPDAELVNINTHSDAATASENFGRLL